MGERVKHLRTKKGMTEKQLARQLGVSEGFIADVESGKRVMNNELISRVSKILEQDFNDTDVYDAEEAPKEEKKAPAAKAQLKIKEISAVWTDALDAVIKTVPVYDYGMSKVIAARQLPVVSNKVDGYAKDKVFYLEIQDDDMLGFRLAKGDRAFLCSTQEIENNSIYLIEYKDARLIRQLKLLDSGRVLLVSNKAGLSTETAAVKEVKVLGKLVRAEIML